MIKFIFELENSNLIYGFALTEIDLNQLQYDKKPIIFNFSHAGQPRLFGMIAAPNYNTPEDILKNADIIKSSFFPYVEKNLNSINDKMLFFPFAKSIIEKFRSSPYWGFDVEMEITNPTDKQLFFSGKNEKEIKKFLRQLNQ